MVKPGLYYITGISGAGKSTACDELKRRHLTAYDTDDGTIAFFYNNKTGDVFTELISPDDRTPQWRSEHTWMAKRETIEKLLDEAKGKPVFLCGTTSNDADELWDMFDRVFALMLDEDTLRDRILNRTTNDYGKNPHEFADILEWQRTAREDYDKLGATIIDATRPINKVIDDVLAQLDSR